MKKIRVEILREDTDFQLQKSIEVFIEGNEVISISLFISGSPTETQEYYALILYK